MKKLATGFMAIVISQVIMAQNVSFGPSVGFGHSWITGTNDVKFKPGVSVGGTLVYSPAEHWGLGGDIRLSFLEGVKVSLTSGNTNDDYTTNATYLRIPLKVSHFFGKYGDRVRPKLFAGPSFGFLLGGKIKSSSGEEGKTKDLLESFDFGFIAGAGLNYRLMKYTWLNVDVAYTNGLIDATKFGGSYNPNRNISLNVGVTFPLGTVTNPK